MSLIPGDQTSLHPSHRFTFFTDNAPAGQYQSFVLILSVSLRGLPGRSILSPTTEGRPSVKPSYHNVPSVKTRTGAGGFPVVSLLVVSVQRIPRRRIGRRELRGQRVGQAEEKDIRVGLVRFPGRLSSDCTWRIKYANVKRAIGRMSPYESEVTT